MNRYIFKFFSIIITTTLSSVAIGQDDVTRLLPASFTAKIPFSWHQDGRVIEIEIENPKDKWVLQRLAFYAYFPTEPSKVKSSSKVPGKKDKITALEEYLDQLDQNQPEVHGLDVNIQPRHRTSIHLEMRDQRKVVKLEITETRGREQTRTEKLWNLIR